MQKLETKASQRIVVKISSKSIDYLVSHLDLEKHEAIRLLRKNEGDLERSLEQFVLGKDCLGLPEYQL